MNDVLMYNYDLAKDASLKSLVDELKYRLQQYDQYGDDKNLERVFDACQTISIKGIVKDDPQMMPRMRNILRDISQLQEDFAKGKTNFSAQIKPDSELTLP